MQDCDRNYCRDKQSSQKRSQDAVLECTCRTQNTAIVLSEHRARFTIKNTSKKEVYVTAIDNCIKILENEKKCDFMVTYKDEEGKESDILYVELKGCDHRTGCEQLLHTVKRFHELHKNRRRICYLVAFPPASAACVQKAMRQLPKGVRLLCENHYTI